MRGALASLSNGEITHQTVQRIRENIDEIARVGSRLPGAISRRERDQYHGAAHLPCSPDYIATDPTKLHCGDP